jgi:hypothetical protein
MTEDNIVDNNDEIVKYPDRTPYIRCLKECIEFVLSNQIDIFKPQDIAWGQQYFALSELGQALLARLVSRNTVWIRSDKMVGCMPRDEPRPEEALLTALDDLMVNNFIQELEEKTCTFENAWEATIECLVMDEIKILHLNMIKSKAKG